jgi:hypothetical protein
MAVIHNLQWFLDRVDTFILRGSTEIFIKDEAMARELHDLQGEGYEFSAKVRVHRKPPEECEACSA